jgi:PPM family protein phosphatase
MILTASYSDIGGRNCNEDTVRLVTRGTDSCCAVLADGLGGHGGGAQASAAAADTICSIWQNQLGELNLEDTVQCAHRAVLKQQSPSCSMKSTVVALCLRPGIAQWAHVGDSRLYYFFNGSLTFRSRDHSASQIAVMLGEITPDQIRFHADRNRVLRALGQEGDLLVETKDQPLLAGQHAFLLCSDGFWEYVLENEMEYDLSVSANPDEWISRMRSRLLKRIPSDNDNNSAAAIWMV